MAAREVMEKSEHVLLSGSNAEEFCDTLERVPNTYFDTHYRRLQKKGISPLKHVQTVGAVALDSNGRLSAASSTGGVVNKLSGRIGDTAVIGAGTYANPNLAVSCTGDGEEFLRKSIASRVATFYSTEKHQNLNQICQKIISEDLNKKLAGLIVVDQKANVALVTNAKMYAGYFKNSKIHVDLVTAESLQHDHMNGDIKKVHPPKSWQTPALHPSVAITNAWYSGVFRIQNAMFHAAVDYFNKVHRYSYVMTPISTNTISSPMGLGSDSEPVAIELYDQHVYLADSMQFTLEYFLRYII